MDHSASKTSKLCIKIKLPAGIGAAEGAGSSSGDLQADQPGGYVCEVCGMKFSSRKSLGGHKGHHHQIKDTSQTNEEEGEEEVSNAKMKNHKHGRSRRCSIIKTGDVTFNSGGKPICPICAKIFPSMNSLFGHMRVHRDRNCQQSRPPPAAPVSSENQIYSDNDNDSQIVIQAAHILLQLSRDICLAPPPASSQRRGPEASGHATKSLGKAIKTQSGSDNLSDHRSIEYEDDTDSEEICGLVTKRKIRKMNYISQLKDSKTEPSEFKCNTCAKSFPTFHALAEHRSSCSSKNKRRKRAKKSSLIIRDAGDHHPYQPVASTEIPFICHICDKIFPTGQALGGHKKRHKEVPAKPLSNGADLAESSNNVVTETAATGGGDEEATGGGHGMYDIDLNKPYLMQEGDEDFFA